MNLPTAVACFPGFLPAVEACSLNWKNVDLGVVSDAKFPMKITLTVPDSSKDAESGVDETSHEALPLVETKRFVDLTLLLLTVPSLKLMNFPKLQTS